MDKVQKWEIAGVPAALAFEAALRMGWLDALGIKAEDLPHLMVITFLAVALLRGALDYMPKPKGGEDDDAS